MMDNPLKEDLESACTLLSKELSQLSGQSLFITGGTGFFGKWILEVLQWARLHHGLDLKIGALSRSPEKFRSGSPHLAEDIDFIQGDIRDFLFPDHSYEFLIHAATEASVSLNKEQPELMRDVVVQGTHRILEFAKYCGAKDILLTSSGAVYGEQPSEVTHMPEDYYGDTLPAIPGDAYGDGKRICEIQCLKSEFNVKIARCYAFSGPYLPMDTHFAFGNFIKDALENRPIKILGDGTPMRSYLYAKDLVVWLIRLLVFGRGGEIYNVGSSEDLSIADLAYEVSQVKSVPVEVKGIPDGRPLKRYVPNVDKIKQELGVKETVSLKQAIEKTITWARLQEAK